MRTSPESWVPPGAWLAAGYADQPHLTRECRDLSGHSPAARHRLRRPGDRVPVPTARELAAHA